ncbi:MAG: hypothetical protein LBJ72_14890 [Dysgonamonadaceae bacterium]|nr:hypothetical protein [Dysgonamonadaceae bacterium]
MSKGIKTYIILLVIIFAITFCAYLFFLWYGLEYAPKYFVLIPLLYMADGYPLSILVGKHVEKGERMSVKKLMVMRLIRIVCSLVVLLLGVVLDKIHGLAFVVLFVIYYIVYLVFETIVMRSSQQTNKKMEV